VPDTFTSDGKTYNVTIYPARADKEKKKYPILVLLHGNFGLAEPYGKQIHALAESLAGIRAAVSGLGETGLGFVTAVLDYYSDPAPPDPEKHKTDQDPVPHVPTLVKAIEHVATREDADAARVGLIGYSLGAAIAMNYIATRPVGSVKVLVDYFGPTKPRAPELPIYAEITAGLSRFPPTLTLHDAKDVVVPVDRSVELHGLLPSGIEHRLCIYVTEPTQPIQVVINPGEEAKYVGNHAFQKGGYADVASCNEAAHWVVRHMPPMGA
jgi:dienelactone hydrolase